MGDKASLVFQLPSHRWFSKRFLIILASVAFFSVTHIISIFILAATLFRQFRFGNEAMRGCVRPSVWLFFFSCAFLGRMWPWDRNFSAFVSLLCLDFPLPAPRIILSSSWFISYFSRSHFSSTLIQSSRLDICARADWSPPLCAVQLFVPPPLKCTSLGTRLYHKYSLHFR